MNNIIMIKFEISPWYLKLHFTIVIHTKTFYSHTAPSTQWFDCLNLMVEVLATESRWKGLFLEALKVCILILWVWFIDCTQIQNTAGKKRTKIWLAKKLNALLACTFETTLVRSSSSLFPTEEEHNNQHYHSQHLFFCMPFFYKTQCLQLHLIFLSRIQSFLSSLS